jgi:hypothetical protein
MREGKSSPRASTLARPQARRPREKGGWLTSTSERHFGIATLGRSIDRDHHLRNLCLDLGPTGGEEDHDRQTSLAQVLLDFQFLSVVIRTSKPAASAWEIREPFCRVLQPSS